MNPRLDRLQPYPFDRLKRLVEGVTPPRLTAIKLSIGEPQHPTPAFIREALAQNLSGLAVYPATAGSERLRESIANWFVQRFGLAHLDPSTEVLPVNGSREALFAFAQCVIDTHRPDSLVGCPNPFYQIYEGAALLGGSQPVFLNQTAENGYGLRLDALSPTDWGRVQLLYVCTPANPSGRVLTLEDWRQLFDLADRAGFVIASDECYSEIYFDEASPPLGGLEAAHALGRDDYRNLVVFTSLSKRSNVPGLRSGAVAGEARILRQFLRYRTYHGCAMSLSVQEASIVAWSDEAHVRDNRALYRQKFDAVLPALTPAVDAVRPEAGFYLWLHVPAAWEGDDERFARDLLARANVSVLPGRYLAREAHHVNPGAGRVRVALVPALDECVEAAQRIASCCH
jgi:N-succinyldiaminopimelate aminotransferase